MTAAGDAAAHCARLVRDLDRDRYLAALFAPEPARSHLMALYAFNAELAVVRERITDPAAGEVRFGWWEEVVDALYAGAALDHPVVHGLAGAVAAGQLPRDRLKGLIEARRFDLYDDPMPDLATLEAYLADTASAVVELGVRVLGTDGDVAPLARPAGIAWGIAGLLRSLPIHRARGQCYVPADLLAGHGVSPAHVLAGRDEPGVGAALAALRARALACLAEARAARHRLPSLALPAMLPLALVEPYCRRLAVAGAGALHTVTGISQWRRQLVLARAALTGRV